MNFDNVIKLCNKIQNIDDFINNLDETIEIVRLDVLNICNLKKLFFYDFDFLFNESKKMLKIQLNKKHLKGTKRLMNFSNIDQCSKWIISRIINNMRNISTNEKYKLFISININQLDESIIDDFCIEEKTLIEDLKKFDSKTIKKAIKSIYNNLAFEDNIDIYDIKYLCNKYNISFNTIVSKNEQFYKTKVEQIEGGNFQLAFNFD